jgi:mono/diheme cytochrome c family protein
MVTGRGTSILSVLIWVVLGVPSGVTAQRPSQAMATFNKDVAPILYEHCVRCHRPNEVAPMSLLTFSDARPWARAMKAKVLAGEMPPWSADPEFGKFSNQPHLTTAQIDTITNWVDGGAPEGDGALPAPPVFNDGWTVQMGRPPDEVLEAPSEFEVPADGDVPTFTVWLKVPFKLDKFVEAMELRPTNRRVLHHASLALGTLPPKTRLGKVSLWTGGPPLDGVRLTSDGRPYITTSNAEFGYPMLFYVPGGGFLRFPQGVAKRIRAGQYLSWGMHLVTTGRPEKTRMRLGLWFARKTVIHEALTMTANIKKFVNGKEIPLDARGRARLPNIPPFAANWSITGVITFPDAVTLYSLWPHMHLRGKDMTFILTYPNGGQETLLRVPKYNMYWQVTYVLTKPIKIPAGSTIAAIADYDNSAANRYNPDPSLEVYWGEQSWNEMFNPFLEVSVDKDDLRFERLLEHIQ